MSWIRKSAKVIGINLAITLFLLAFILIVPAVFSDLGNLTKKSFRRFFELPRENLAVYGNEPWAIQYYIESTYLKTSYYDFIGWRRREFAGETITVDADGFRRHSSKASGAAEAEIWMFGGSTVWGTAVPDNGTLPAYLEQVAGRSTFNFGEVAYVSHQSLNLLMRELIAGKHPKLVIFYDGVNEVAHKCRTELGPYSAAREEEIRSTLQSSDSALLQLFHPLMKSIAQGLSKNSKKARWYDCDSNPGKADLIAETMVFDWMVAKQLVEARGGKFLAVLQPVSHLGSPNLSQLPAKEKNERLKRQYETVYPLFRQKLAKNAVPYLDLTDIFNGTDPFYLDFCHVMPAGNAKIAKAVAERIQ